MADSRRTEGRKESGDAFLRQMGFKVLLRPLPDVSLWERCGKVFTRREAEEIAECEYDLDAPSGAD